jgi:hypothetical protein
MSQRLRIDMMGYWHPGTGRGQGSHLDAITHRGGDGLPRLPGRTVRGIVRDAVNRWETFGGYGAAGAVRICDQLFGPYAEPEQGVADAASTGQTWPGLLRFSDAQLPAVDRQAIAADGLHAALIAGLYRSHFSTRIEHESGTADENTLRGIELVVPLTLYADIGLVATARYRQLESRWPSLLRAALPLVRAVGAHRSRGLGRATLTLEDLA